MQHVQTLLSAPYVLPFEGDNAVEHDATIVVDNGRILDLIPTRDVDSLYTASEHLILEEHALMPGMINSHTHAAMSLLRGLGSDLPLMQWLNDYIWPRELQWVNEQFVQDGAQLAMAEMLHSGITCFNDMYFFPEVTAHAALNIGMRACIGMIVLEFPSAYAQNPTEYFSKGLALHDQFKNHPLIHTLFAPHAPYTVSDDSFRKLSVYANELDLLINTHLHETANEIEASMKEHGARPIERLSRLGMLNDNLIAIHAIHLTDHEIELLAANNVHVIHCPSSNLKLASGFCPVEKLRRHRISLSIGTDGSASNDALDMFSEIKLAALLAKGIAGDAQAFPALDVLRAVTIDAARGLGLEQEIGSISRGKSADLIAINLNQVETQPFYDLPTQLVYSTHREFIDHVWVAGRQLLKNRQLTSISEMELIHKARQWQSRLQ